MHQQIFLNGEIFYNFDKKHCGIRISMNFFLFETKKLFNEMELRNFFPLALVNFSKIKSARTNLGSSEVLGHRLRVARSFLIPSHF